jgi:hypothetical protein
MKVDGINSVVVSSGVEKRQKFRVAQNAKIFMMLSSSLYNDKIAAPIRELGTNAIDAHIKGKTDKQFYVHIPTVAEPYFSVRDYGPGLNELELDELYTVYGMSDKSESDEYVGAWGLGSKSPLAYVKDNFIVTSRKDGKKYTCIVALDENGEPELTYFPTVDCNEPSGVEVKFNVHRNDIHTFADKINSIYCHFGKYFPKSNVPINKFTYKESTDLYKVPANLSTYSQNFSYAVMGFVKYPIDIAQFAGYEPLLNEGYHYDFNIGEIEMNISREGLQYNKKTVEAIKARLEATKKHLAEKFEKQFKDCKSLYQAFRIVQRDAKQWNIIKGAVKFNGVDIPSHFTINHPHEHHYLYGYRSKKNVKKATGASLNIQFQYNHKYLIADVDKNVNMVAAYYAAQDKDCYVFVETDKHKFSDLLALGLFDKSDLIYVSEVADKIREEVKSQNIIYREKRGVYSKKKIFSFSKIQQHARQDNWVEEEIDFDDGGVYQVINRYEPCTHGFMDNASLRKTVDAFKLLTGEEVEFYGVKSAESKKFIESEDWVCLNDYLMTKVLEYCEENELSDYLQVIVENCGSYGNNPIESEIEDLKILFKSNQITSGELFDTVEFYKKAQALYNSNKLSRYEWITIKSLIKDKLPESKYTVAKLYKKYPLLQQCGNIPGDCVEHFVKYVQAIDNDNF